MSSIKLYADGLVQLLGPTDELDDTPITSISSCTARLYDDRKDAFVLTRREPLTAEAVAGVTQISLDDTSRFHATESVDLELDNGGFHVTTIASVDSAVQITLAAALPYSASQGRVLRRFTHPIGATVLDVSDGAIYGVGDAVEVRQDDGTRHATSIASRASRFVTLADPLTVACTNGKRISRKLGANITMTVFNEAQAAAYTTDWGFQGVIANDHAGIENGQLIRIEIELVTAGGQVLRENVRAMVGGDG